MFLYVFGVKGRLCRAVFLKQLNYKLDIMKTYEIAFESSPAFTYTVNGTSLERGSEGATVILNGSEIVAVVPDSAFVYLKTA